MDCNGILVMLVILLCAFGSESLWQSRYKRSNEQIETLRKKLSSLQDLLTSMTNDDKKSKILEESTTVKPEVISKGKETMMTRSNENEAEKPKAKLSSDEVAVLMALRNTLQRQQQNRISQSALKEELENNESYYDKPMAEDGTDEVTFLKALASKLSENRNKQEQTQINTQDALSKEDNAQPKEGKFTLFRQEVLAQVEDRLLQDVDFALRMGFSVEEILTDLQGKEQRFKELKLEELRQQIEALKKHRE